MYSMGDWVYGELVQANLTENVDFGWVAHPGSDGTYLLVSDGFTLARGAPHPEETLAMLRTMGQRVVQEDFNLQKGAICARTDCDRLRFGPYLNWAMDTLCLPEKCLIGSADIGSLGRIGQNVRARAAE